MKWRWLAFLIALCLLGVLTAAAVVAVTVSVNFTVSAPGVVEPARTIRVTAAEDGLATFVRPPGRVEKGAVLFRQRATDERRRLATFVEELALLEKRREHERERLASWSGAQQIELALLNLDRQETTARRDDTGGVLAELENGIDERTVAREQVRKDLAEAEFKILHNLAKEQTVPLMEVAKAEAEAGETKLQLERAGLEEEKRQFSREDAIRRLETELDRQSLKIRAVSNRVQDLHTLMELNRQILDVKARMQETDRALARKELVAPWPGEWGARMVVEGEYVEQGKPVGVLYDARSLNFAGRVRGSQFPWLRQGQRVKVRLSAYPFLKYGLLPAVVTSLEPRARSAGPEFRIEARLAGDGPYQPVAGMAGTADVIVFRGTLLQYLMAEPEEALSGAPPLADTSPPQPAAQDGAPR